MLRLPKPPSVNSMFATDFKTRRRFKTKVYTNWIKEADEWLVNTVLPTVETEYHLEIILPRTRGDIDNYVKPIADYLVSRGVTPDDKHMRSLSVRRDPHRADCWVRAVEICPECEGVPSAGDRRKHNSGQRCAHCDPDRQKGNTLGVDDQQG